MRSFSVSILSVALLSGLLATAHAQDVSCSNAQFSDEVLQRFPSVREACLDVITNEGSYFAVFKADLLRVTSSGVQIRPALPSGKHADPRFVQVSSARRVLVDGKPVRFSDLELGQELTVYIKVTEPMVAFTPVAESEPWELAPLEEVDAARVATAELPPMPHTAGVLPFVGTGGGTLVLVASLIGIVRRLRSVGAESR
jgi:hypothetical protein